MSRLQRIRRALHTASISAPPALMAGSTVTFAHHHLAWLTGWAAISTAVLTVVAIVAASTSRN